MITLAFGNDGLFSVFVDADDDVETFLSVDGDGGRSVLVVKSLAPPCDIKLKLKLMKYQVLYKPQGVLATKELFNWAPSALGGVTGPG